MDTEAFNAMSGSHEADPSLILNYQILGSLEIIRTPYDPAFQSLKKVPHYREQIDETGNISAIEYELNDLHFLRAFRYKNEDIATVGKHLLSKTAIPENELKQIILAFIQAVLQEDDYASIFITDKKILLKNRLWFESHFPGFQINIVTFDEAKEIIDLFLKYRGTYYLASNDICDKGYFYLLSFRTKI
ncbi:MAG: hypothetical protein ACREBU_24345, partial [Nitrososphaera sp.]